jgi:hypothetical protein
MSGQYNFPDMFAGDLDVNHGSFGLDLDVDDPSTFLNGSFGSEPLSGSMTNLTTPSPMMHTSPDFASPFYGEEDITNPGWAPLFTPVDTTSVQVETAAPDALLMDRQPSSSDSFSSANNSPANAVGVRRASGKMVPPPVPRHKHSPSGGVTKGRTRKAPLKDITYDASNPTERKRAKNTLAARESRTRKAEHVSQLEARNSYLESALEDAQNKLRAMGYHGPMPGEEE